MSTPVAAPPAPTLSRNGIAYRIAQDFVEGEVINLGVGVPTMCGLYLGDKEIFLHAEQGVLGHGELCQSQDEVIPGLTNAGMQPVKVRPGMVIMDHGESFGLIRGGHLDATCLGAYQVAVNGDMANFWLPGATAGAVGGAQDLAFCAKRVVVALQLTRRSGRFVNTLDLEMTAPRCVSRIVTEFGVIDLVDSSAIVRELAPGWDLEHAQQFTEVELIPDSNGVGQLDVPVDDDMFWNAKEAA